MINKTFQSNDCNNIQYNILVVDDSKVFNQKITDSLVEFGHNITQAFTLTDAKNFIENNEYDFILLDLILPDGEGDQLIDTLSMELKSKIIVLSGDEDSQRRNYIFESGILDYFSKTNPINLILEDIKKLLCVVGENKNINILIVDDSSFMRKALKNILIPKRYNIFEAKDAQDGLGVLEKEEIHLLLLDYEMPGMDGASMLEKIKQEQKFLELPVIMLSGSADKNLVARILKHGASDFIKKPFIAEELLLKCDLQVKQYLNIKRIKHKENDLKIALKQSKEAQQHKAMFLANMSHEIRTPLNAIMGFIDLLKDEEEDKHKLEHLSTIKSSGEHLLVLVNDILDLSKMQNNKLNINNETFVLEELHDTIVNLFTPMMQEKSLIFNTNIETNVPRNINSDFLRIKQIITNFLSNAIKFTPNLGTITFNISLFENNIKFSVQDTGIGIEKSNQIKIFDIFTQAEDSTTKKFGGTGLGLSICNQLVSLIGGDIGVKSQLDKGSEFYFTLPIKEIKTNEIVHHIVNDNKQKIDTKGIFNNHILLVEDNKTNQQFMTILLKKLGFTFDIANDGVEAVDNFKCKNYDLILMDENMPNMSGIEATKIIRTLQKQKKNKYTPIIALTANAIEGDRERFMKAGMDEYLAKPINKQKLIEVLNSQLNQDKIYDMIDKNDDKKIYPEQFIKNTTKILNSIDKACFENDFKLIIKLINLVKISTLKFKLQDIFTLCLNIEQSAKDEDIKSCKNFLIVFKGLF